MILETFEQAYKQKLKTDLATYITDKTVIVSNDITFKAFSQNKDAIHCILTSGIGGRTMQADLIEDTLTITLVCDVNYQKDLMVHLEQFIDATSGVIDTLSIETNVAETTKTYQYRINWKKPTQSATPSDIRVENNRESMKVCYITLQGNISYGSDINLAPSNIKIKVNNINVLDITGSKILVNYSRTKAPQYKQMVLFGKNYPVAIKVADIETIIVVMLKNTDVASYILGTVNSIDISFDNGTNYINCATYQATEEYNNGVPVVTLTLSRGNA